MTKEEIAAIVAEQQKFIVKDLKKFFTPFNKTKKEVKNVNTRNNNRHP